MNIQLIYWLQTGYISQPPAVTHSLGHMRDLTELYTMHLILLQDLLWKSSGCIFYHKQIYLKYVIIYFSSLILYNPSCFCTTPRLMLHKKSPVRTVGYITATIIITQLLFKSKIKVAKLEITICSVYIINLNVNYQL